MSRVATPLLVWPLALLGSAAAIALSVSGLLSLTAAHASAPAAVHVKATMPAPRLLAAPHPPVVALAQPTLEAPAASAEVAVAVARVPMARVGQSGATLRGAAGEGAVAVWQLRPGAPIAVLASRDGWSEVDEQGLVGWVPTSALSSD
jgi:SH3 domain-containing protein